MLDVLSSLLDTINGLVQFVINTITALYDFIIHIPTYVTFLVNSINVMPIILIPFMIICISTYVILFIINRR